jgi:hypothetical protein
VLHFNRRTRTGTIVGVIGGFQLGGYTDAISYSAYLGRAVQRLYRQAITAEGPPVRPGKVHLLLSMYVDSRLTFGRTRSGGAGA